MQPRSIVSGLATLFLGAGTLKAQTPLPPTMMGGVPAVSPDGRSIAFVSDRDGAYEAYVVDLTGKQLKRITTTPYREIEVTWAGDGEHLLTYGIDGDSARLNVVRVADGVIVSRPVAVKGFVTRAQLTADNKHIILSWGPSPLQAGIYDIDLVSGARTLLTPEGSPSISPSISPDGQRIAYMMLDVQRRETHLHLMDRDGASNRVLVVPPGLATWPTWHPNGDRITIQANEAPDAGTTIYVVELADGKLGRLIDAIPGKVNETAVWLADGRFVFQSNRNGPMDLFVANHDGSGVQKLLP